MSWDTAGASGGWNSAGASTSFDAQPAANSFQDAGEDSYGQANGYGGNEDMGSGGFGGAMNDGACFNCGEQGHSKADCPNPAKPRPCYNCGEEGHTKNECTNPTDPNLAREFTGTCRLCEQQGHRAGDCPSAPPKLCNNCKEEGHSALDCKNNRKVEWPDVEDVPALQAWAKLKAASEECDMDEMKEAVFQYIKATPDATWFQLEKAFRSQNLNIYLIAIEKELAVTFTNMDLQGKLDCKYTVSFRLSDKAQRPKEKDAWPATEEENFERLADAGISVERGIPKCSNCEQLGHMFKSCPEEKNENTDRAVVKCFNCEEVGHRVRDCPNPRPDKFACRNCKQSGHSSKECPEPRSAEGVECKKCGEVGHFSRDCPQGGGGDTACRNCGQEGHRAKECTNERVLKCRNCDAEGHISKECPKPRDYSRVQCQNCKQMGHTKVRCKEPLVEDEDAGNAGYGGNGGNAGYGGDTGAKNGGYSGDTGYGDSGNTDDFSSGAVIASGGDNWGAGGGAASSGW